MKWRPWAAWGVMAVFIGLCVAWLFVFPERPDRLYRTIPAGATLVSEHANLAAAWPAALSNATVRQAVAVYGGESPGELARDKKITRLLSWVADDRALVAWVPALCSSGAPAWVAASRVGGRSTWMRLFLAMRRVPGLGSIARSERGTRYISIDAEFMPGAVLSLAAREGILMVALSCDPDAVQALDERLLHDAPPAPLFETPEPWAQRHVAPHRLWVAASLMRSFPGMQGALHAQLMQLDTQGTELRVQGLLPRALRQHPPLPPVPALELLGDDIPSAIAVVPYVGIIDVLSTPIPALATWRDQALTSTEGAFAYLSGKPYGGRIMGLAIPALTVIAPWQGEPSLSGVTGFLDFLNQQARLGLIPRQEPKPEGSDRLLIDTTLTSGWGRRRDEECPAIELRSQRLVVSSCAGSLDQQATAVVSGKAAWREALRAAYAGGDLRAWAWVEPGAVAAETRHLLAVYRLARIFLGDVQHEQVGERLDQAQTLLDVLSAGGAVELTLTDGAETLPRNWDQLTVRQGR